MALRILGLNGGATIAESTNNRPVCLYCDWLTLESIVMAGNLIGSPNVRHLQVDCRITWPDGTTTP
jgi:hypothetical protein